MLLTLRTAVRIALTSAVMVAIAVPALAAVVQFSGTLKAGFSDSFHGNASNNGLPVCAVSNPFAIQLSGTMHVVGYANQGAGTHPDITFEPYGAMFAGAGTNLVGGPGGNGGAIPRVRSTCQVKIPPFINPRLRSRSQFAGGGWPQSGGVVGQGQGFDFVGSTLSVPIPFLTGLGHQEIQKGARTFGGGVKQITDGPIIWSSYVSASAMGLGPGVQLGINTTIVTPTLLTSPAPLATFGLVPYIGGYLPTGPNAGGGDSVTHRVPISTTGGGTAPDPQGVITGHQTTYTNFFGLRSPGGSTINQQGAIVTTMGLITGLPTSFYGTAGEGFGINSPFQIRVAVNQYTTGTVFHQDSVGDYITSRGTTGFDNTGLAGAGGTTRQIQLVSPWSATIRGVGPFGLNAVVPQLGFGGMGKITLDIQPAPEPGAMLSLGFGTLALLGIRRIRRNR